MNFVEDYISKMIRCILLIIMFVNSFKIRKCFLNRIMNMEILAFYLADGRFNEQLK